MFVAWEILGLTLFIGLQSTAELVKHTRKFKFEVNTNWKLMRATAAWRVSPNFSASEQLLIGQRVTPVLGGLASASQPMSHGVRASEPPLGGLPQVSQPASNCWLVSETFFLLASKPLFCQRSTCSWRAGSIFSANEPWCLSQRAVVDFPASHLFLAG
jgi:hypothetical protein